jgi:hypothetical protein
MNKQSISLTLTVVMTLILCHNAQANTETVRLVKHRQIHLSDTSAPVRELNGSKIYLSVTVKDSESWKQILLQDTIVISYITRQAKEPVFITITDISRIKKEYKFRLIARPEPNPEKLAQQLLATGPTYYRATTRTDKKTGKTEIIRFEFEGIEL